MSTLSKFMIFASGAAIGSLVTWRFLKTKYERIAQEEIESVKEVFSKRRYKASDLEESGEDHSDDVMLTGLNEKPDISEYASTIKDLGYSQKEEEEDDEKLKDKPYVISPEEYDENEDYEKETLTYYADGVLTDWYDDIIENVDEVVGTESLTRFGEYEDDTVYVRNDRQACDYEIQRDTRNFSDVHPDKMED